MIAYFCAVFKHFFHIAIFVSSEILVRLKKIDKGYIHKPFFSTLYVCRSDDQKREHFKLKNTRLKSIKLWTFTPVYSHFRQGVFSWNNAFQFLCFLCYSCVNYPPFFKLITRKWCIPKSGSRLRTIHLATDG